MIGEGASYGVDINTGGITDSFANFVWEPAVVKVSQDSIKFLLFYFLRYLSVDMIDRKVYLTYLLMADQCYKRCN